MNDLRQLVNEVKSESEMALVERNKRQEASAKLLDEVIAMLQPVVEHIGTRPIIEHDCEGNNTRHESRFLSLSYTSFGPPQDDTLDGFQELGLSKAGKLVQLTYEGEVDEWGCEIAEYETALACVQDGWNEVEDYLKHTLAALYAGKEAKNKQAIADISRRNAFESALEALKQSH